MRTTRQPIAHRIRNDADTWSLVEDVTEATRIGVRHCRWPSELASRNAANIMHRYAAELEYIPEHGTQVIRAPWVSLHDGRADCKSTAVLIASMCAAAGRRVDLKFVQFTEGRTHWAHVYAVVDGRPVDPLLPFGEEYPYIRHHTVPVA